MTPTHRKALRIIDLNRSRLWLAGIGRASATFVFALLPPVLTLLWFSKLKVSCSLSLYACLPLLYLFWLWRVLFQRVLTLTWTKITSRFHVLTRIPVHARANSGSFASIHFSIYLFRYGNTVPYPNPTIQLPVQQYSASKRQVERTSKITNTCYLRSTCPLPLLTLLLTLSSNECPFLSCFVIRYHPISDVPHNCKLMWLHEY